MANLIPEFEDMFAAKQINLISAAKIAVLSKEAQKSLFKYAYLINNISMQKS